MSWLRRRWFLPAVMVPLFMLAFLRAELRWRDCMRDDGRVCFNYPAYLQYETRQALDLHWPALMAAAIVDQLPASISSEYDKRGRGRWTVYVVTALSVIGFWWLIGVWWARLFSARRLVPDRRAGRTIILVLVGILTPLAYLAVWLGIRGGYEGPTMTDAGFLCPTLLAVMALIECGVLPRSLNKRVGQLLIAALLLCVYVGTDIAYRAERRQYELRTASKDCKAGPDTVCFDLPFQPSPDVQDAIMLHAPPLIGVELVSMLYPSRVISDSAIATGMRCLMVGIYWFTLVSLAGGHWPSRTRTYRVLHGWLFASSLIVFGFASLGWILGASAHGPTGLLGVVCGTGFAIYAFHSKELTRKNPSPARD